MTISTAVQTVEKSKTAALIALLIAVAGLATHPDILGLLPEKWSFIVSGFGAFLQAITRSLQGR